MSAQFKLGDGQEITVLPLSLNAARHLARGKVWEALEGTDNAVRLDAILTISHVVLRRSIPGLTEEQAGDLMDLSRFEDFLSVVMEVNGMVKAAPGEAASQ